MDHLVVNWEVPQKQVLFALEIILYHLFRIGNNFWLVEARYQWAKGSTEKAASNESLSHQSDA